MVASRVTVLRVLYFRKEWITVIYLVGRFPGVYFKNRLRHGHKAGAMDDPEKLLLQCLGNSCPEDCPWVEQNEKYLSNLLQAMMTYGNHLFSLIEYL